MAKFLTTSATTYHLEELIKNATEKVVLISPFLKLNDRVKELLEDKNRLKIDIRIVYGKSELQPTEINWLKELSFVRTSFCKNLHAKCYMSEEACIITSLNLYEFSQVNNNEMGVLITRTDDADMYRDAHDEAQRIIRISDEVRISLETVDASQAAESVVPVDSRTKDAVGEKLTTSKLAKKLGIKTNEFLSQMVENGYLTMNGEEHSLTQKGVDRGGEAKSGRYGDYFVWPAELSI
jgi:phosphatidylserine/phosphatidylglycerophosphate/cardiolipin synthase-like enzyme